MTPMGERIPDWSITSRAAILVSKLPPECVTARMRLVISLRSRGLSYAQIGTAFGLSGERIRQVERGIKVKPCQCDRCGKKEMR